MQTNMNDEYLHSDFQTPPKSHTGQQGKQAKASMIHVYSITQRQGRLQNAVSM